LLANLASLNTASKHWIIRQYDHEVQGGSVVKPLVGVNNDGPGDAAVVRPRLDSNRGLVISCGLNPSLADIDPYQMAASAIDEAVRNAVAVGADPNTIVLLDNFCWGNTDRPETLGSLVEAALACYDVSLGFGMPFISGKDSLNNEFRSGKETISIPPTLLISAMGQIDDVAKSVTMDLKAPGNVLYLLGAHTCGVAARPLDVPKAKRLYEKLHGAIIHGVLRSVHDLSEGGLAVTVAEMCFAGGFGAELSGDFDENMLFAEVNSSFVIEVESGNSSAVESHFAGMPLRKLGRVTDKTALRFGNVLEADIDELKAAWQKPLDW
jgi:phosphoribosylformylglycinamidine synthase